MVNAFDSAVDLISQIVRLCNDFRVVSCRRHITSELIFHFIITPDQVIELYQGDFKLERICFILLYFDSIER